MIFSVVEQVMNGTVTMRVNTFAIEASSFENALEILKRLATKNDAKIVDGNLQDDGYFYQLEGAFPVWGCLFREPMKVFSKETI